MQSLKYFSLEVYNYTENAHAIKSGKKSGYKILDIKNVEYRKEIHQNIKSF